ncbi:MAG TPA: class I SAM-dependent methyltransferase [Ktedonobacterales bacterium]|nr:class I SAM-dependent methyltransferase [Ktedonobacterales bacterium]
MGLQSRFSTNPIPIIDWELGLIDLSNVRKALDAGCGTGNFLVPLARRLTPQGATVIGLDLSAGTLGQAQARVKAEGLAVTCVIGDVETLPFDDCSFDLALANYMLYHVPDLDHAIAQLRRVLRPGGTLIAATNGQGHMRDIWRMVEQAVADVNLPRQSVAEIMERERAAGEMSFQLDNGAEWLCRHFSDVRIEHYPDELHVSEVEPLVAYVESMWSLDVMLENAAATDDERTVLRARILDRFHEIIQERIAADGVVRIAKETGAFVCTSTTSAADGAKAME